MPTHRTIAVKLLRERPDLADRLLLLAADPPGEPITDAQRAVGALWPLLGGRATEALAVLAIDRRNRVIAREVLTTGCDGSCIVDSRQILRWSLLKGRSGAHGIILAHNHPSGDPTPSPQDREVTRRVAVAGSAVGVRLLDHLVVTDDPNCWRSFAQDGALPAWGEGQPLTLSDRSSR